VPKFKECCGQTQAVSTPNRDVAGGGCSRLLRALYISAREVADRRHPVSAQPATVDTTSVRSPCRSKRYWEMIARMAITAVRVRYDRAWLHTERVRISTSSSLSSSSASRTGENRSSRRHAAATRASSHRNQNHSDEESDNDNSSTNREDQEPIDREYEDDQDTIIVTRYGGQIIGALVLRSPPITGKPTTEGHNPCLDRSHHNLRGGNPSAPKL
jgi:hypothetical protein